MSTNKMFELSLRITHPSIDPDEITATLGLEPNIKQRVGDRRKTPKGRELEGMYTRAYWNRRLSVDHNESLSGLIQNINNHLVDRKKFLCDLVDSGGEVEYFIGCFAPFNTGDTLSWKLLEQCAQLKVNLSFDIYGEQPKVNKDQTSQ